MIVEKELSHQIVAGFFATYNELRYGLPEHIYARALEIVLRTSGLRVEREYPFPVDFRGQQIGFFRADMLVERRVIVEIKATEHLDRSAFAQVRTYLAASGLELGILLHFGPEAEFHRQVRTVKRQIQIRSDSPDS